MKKRLPLFSPVVGMVTLLLAALLSPAFAVQNRVQASPDLTQKAALQKSVSPLLAKSVDNGRLDASQNLGRIILTLAPTEAQEQAATALVRALHDRNSPQYHKWLTPAQFGDQFGISAADAAQVKGWLESQGLTVHEVSQSRRFITFSGKVVQVEKAFSTQLHSYAYNGKPFIANSSSVQIPSALQSVIKGVNLFGHPRPANLKIVKQAPFDPTSGIKGLQSFSDGAHFLAPSDFAAIYDINPLYQSGIDGTGQSIAIVGRTNISASDVNTFRSYFGLPANPPNIIINGDDPGITGDVIEAMLDIEWSGAVARGATVNYVASASNFDDGVSVSATYIVDHNIAPVMSTSYGECEAAEGSYGNSFWYYLWQQAAAQGITAMVSTGDNGGAGCDAPGSGNLASGGLAISGLASTPFNVAVGGTQFDDAANPSQYWGLLSDPVSKQSVLGYIPEKIWNESSNDPNSVSLWAGSGGASSWWIKPDWQVGAGVPNDGVRDIPDISLTAAGHDGYLIIYGGSLYSVGGTSASSPSFAGIMALVNQQTGSAQGQANYTLYQLASGPNAADIFHDTVNGDNKVPDTTGAFTVGYSAAPGYDLASGLGSVDVTQLVNHWADVTPALTSVMGLTTYCLNGSCSTYPHGYPIHFQPDVSSASGSGPTPTGSTVMVAVSQATGNAISLTPTNIAKAKATALTKVKANAVPTPPSGNNVITGASASLSNGSSDNYFATIPGGTWNVYAQYAGDANYLGSTSGSNTITITKEDSATTIGPLTGGWQVSTPVQLQYGETLPMAIYIAGVSGYGYPSGSVDIQINGSTIASNALQYGEVGTTQQSSTIFTLNGFSAGQYSLSAAYPGDASFNPSTSTAYTLTVSKADTYISGFSQTGTAIPGTKFTLSGYVNLNNPGSGPMDGTVNFLDLTNPSTPVTLNTAPIAVGTDGSFSSDVQFATAGTYRIQVQFLGSANLNPSVYTKKFAVLGIASSTTAVSTQTASVVAGGAATYSASVTSTVAERIPSGTVTFTDGSTTVGTATLDANGNASATTNLLVVSGAHSINAIYSGDSYFSTSTSAKPAVTQVTTVSVPTTLATNGTPAVTGNSVTFTATIGTSSRGTLPVPTGTVTFYDASTSLGTGTVDATGKATYATSTLAIGSHAISATYGGDQTYAASTSNSVSQVVTGVPDYSLQIVPSTLNLVAGQSGTVLFNILPVNGFNQTINFSCSGLPAKATCSFSPSSVTPDGSNKPVSSTLTVATNGAMMAGVVKHNRWIAASVIAFAGVLCVLPFSVRKRRWGLAMFLTVVALVAFAASCGGSSHNSNFVSPGSYAISVQAQAGTGTPKTGALTINVTY